MDEQRVLRRVLRRCLDGGGRVDGDRVRGRLMAFCRRVERTAQYVGRTLDGKSAYISERVWLGTLREEAQEYRELIRKGML